MNPFRVRAALDRKSGLLAAYLLGSVGTAYMSFPAASIEPGISGGVRIGGDLIPSAKVISTADVPTGEFFVRVPLASSTSLEAAVGYRHYAYSEFGGRWSVDYSLTQVPVLVGIHYMFGPEGVVSPFGGAGVHCAYSRDSLSGYSYPSTSNTGGSSRFALGAYGQLGLAVAFTPSLSGEALVRYVLNPVSSSTGEPSNQDYLAFRVGVHLQF
jgi:hypothetical protein